MKSCETAGRGFGDWEKGARAWAWGAHNIRIVDFRNTVVKTGEIMHSVECDVWDCLLFVNFVCCMRWHSLQALDYTVR
jgi:hypothetical protein